MQLFSADATIFKKFFFAHKKLKKKPPSKVAQKYSKKVFLHYCLDLPKRHKEKNLCSKMWLIDQLYIKLGIRSLTWDIEEVANLLDNFCRGILRPFLDELGFISQSNETGHDRQCRATVFGYLASLRDTDIQSAAKEMFNNHINGNQPLVAGNSGVLLRCQILKHQLLRQMFVRKLLVFSSLFFSVIVKGLR